jgi:transcriptional regulator with XRE-family HTH domain
MGQGWKKYQYDHLVFGRTIQTYRTALGWSLGALSRRTGINKGTLQQIEKRGRSVPESDRVKLVEVLSEALETTNKRFDRRKFLALARVGATAAPKKAIDVPTTERSPISLITRYSGICLDLAESHIATLRSELYQGKALFVMTEAEKWYRKLTSSDLPDIDKELATMQLRFGILLGQAQEAVHPWYQRCTIALHTYDQVEDRILARFPLNSFQADYALLHALRAPLYREIGEFEKSVAEFNNGCDYAEKMGDLFLETMLVRKLAHLWIVRGDETKWERAIERSRKKSSNSQLHSCLVEAACAGGYRRLAYNPWIQLPESIRKHHAERAIDLFKQAQALYPDPWRSDTGLIGPDEHPLHLAVLRAQCFVWIDPYETLRFIEELRPQAALLCPALLAKMDFTVRCAKKMLARRTHDPVPVFNLDAQYSKRSQRKEHQFL